MSTLKVAAVNNPSASSGGLAFSAAGNVTGGGLDLVVPTSIAYSGGSASVSGGAVTFSGVSSISLNGCFTSTYQNYRIVMNMTQSNSAGTVHSLRFRAGGVDASTGYVTQRMYGYVTNVGALQPSTTLAWLGNNGVTEPFVVELSAYDPQTAAYTRYSGIHSGPDSATTTMLNLVGGVLRNTTQYDGFSVFPDSGTISGTLRIYGYHN